MFKCCRVDNICLLWCLRLSHYRFMVVSMDAELCQCVVIPCCFDSRQHVGKWIISKYVEGLIQYQWQLPVSLTIYWYIVKWIYHECFHLCNECHSLYRLCLWIHITISEYNWSCCQRSIHICHYQQEGVSCKEQNSQSQRKQVHNACKRANFCYTKQEVKKKKKNRNIRASAMNF